MSRTAIWLGAFLLAPVKYWALAVSPLFVLLLALTVSGHVIGPLDPLRGMAVLFAPAFRAITPPAGQVSSLA